MEKLDNKKNASKNMATQAEDVHKVIDIVFLCLNKWYWFVISVFVMMVLAYIYLAKTQPQWTRNALVEIKDDHAGRNVNNRTGINDIGLIKSTSSVDNEKYMFMSPDVMMEVVKRLKLQDNYLMRGKLRTAVLYDKSLPIEIVLPDADPEDSYSLKLELNGDDYVISNLRKNGFRSNEILSGKVGKTIKTPIGRLVVNPTLYYNSNVITIYYGRGGITGTTTSWSSRVDVALADKLTDIVSLTLSDVSAKRAEDVLNTLIQVYNEKWVETKNQATLATLNFIREKLAALENDLSGVDQTISEFKSRNMLPDVQSAAQMYMTKNQQVQDQVVTLSSQLEMSNYIRDFLRKSAKYALIPSGTGLNATALEAQIKDYNDLVLKRQGIINNSSVNSTLLPSIEQQIQIIKQSIQKGLDNQNISLQKQISQLRTNEIQTQSRIQANPKQAKALLSVERQQQVKQTLYIFLLQKREETELSCAFTAYNTHVIKTPHGSLSPSSPKTGQIQLIAFVLGLLIPFGIFYLRKLLTTTVQTKEELKNVVTMPLVAEIPDATPRRRKWYQPWKLTPNVPHLIVVERGNRNVVNEAFRIFRTNMEFINSENKHLVMGVTSYNVDSGKTFVTINSGIAFALQNKKVLLIDCDIRKASLSDYIGKPKEGISDYLSGHIADYHSLIMPYKDIENLSIMPVGTIPPNPTELISLPAFGHVIKQVREEYDYIILDCPPIEIVADTQIINRHIDKTCFVIRAGLMDRTLLIDLEEQHQEGKFASPVMILNGVSMDVIYGYGYRRYGYGRRYGYRKYGYYHRKYGYGAKYGYGSYYGSYGSYGAYYGAEKHRKKGKKGKENVENVEDNENKD